MSVHSEVNAEVGALKLRISQLESKLEKNNQGFKKIQQSLGTLPNPPVDKGSPLAPFVSTVQEVLGSSGKAQSTGLNL
jgi:hypothetical protein